MKTTLKEKALMLFGYKYVANTSTKEIHRLTNPKCHATEHLAKHNRKYLTEKQCLDYLLYTTGYNGCRFCLSEYDNG